MNTLFSAAAGASLLACVSALAGNSSGMTPEQYCFPRFGGPFPDEGGVWPSVTMIYKGETLTATPFAAVACEALPNNGGGGAAASTVSASSPGPSGAFSGGFPGASLNPDATPISDSLGGPSSSLGSAVAGFGTQSGGSGAPLPTSNGPPGNSAIGNSMAVGPTMSQNPTAGAQASSMSQPNAGMSSGLVNSSGSSDDAFTRSNSLDGAPLTPGAPVGSNGLSGTPLAPDAPMSSNGLGDTPLASGASTTSNGLGNSPLVSGSGNNGTPLAPTSSIGLSGTPPASGTPTTSNGLGSAPLASGALTSDAPTSNSRPSGGLDSGGLVSSGLLPSAVVSGSLSGATDEQPNPIASTDPSAPTKLPGAQTPSGSNSTIQLSPGAVEALQLAQFLKNLGVSAFNTTEFANGDNATTSVIANISKQEYKQHRALTDMLRRSGNADIPPCQYTLPTHATDMELLRGTLKSVEVGAFMSLSESLAADATQVAILLSSIASVAARQNAMLQAYAHLNTSMASFETPLPATLAYSLAWNYVQPGSCKAELPMAILPTLSIGDKVVGHARSNDTVTFSWDGAARAAAARSGKPLFIGWVNQVDAPAYTPLDAFGDDSGTTVVPPQLSGTAFAVLTTQPDLLDVGQLTEATLAGPVVISLL